MMNEATAVPEASLFERVNELTMRIRQVAETADATFESLFGAQVTALQQGKDAPAPNSPLSRSLFEIDDANRRLREIEDNLRTIAIRISGRDVAGMSPKKFAETQKASAGSIGGVASY